MSAHREVLQDQGRQANDTDYVKRAATGEPFNGVVSGSLPLIWANARVVCDSPEKKKVVSGAMLGQLMRRDVADATIAVQSELLIVTPYLIPGKECSYSRTCANAA